MVQLGEPLRLSAQQSAIDFITRRSSMQSESQRHNPHQERTLCNDTLILSIIITLSGIVAHFAG